MRRGHPRGELALDGVGDPVAIARIDIEEDELIDRHVDPHQGHPRISVSLTARSSFAYSARAAAAR